MGGDNRRQISVAEAAALRVVVSHGAGKIQMTTYVVAVVAVSGVDRLVAGTTQRIAAEEGLDEILRNWTVRDSCTVGGGSSPVAVPDNVNRHRVSVEHRAAMIVDAITLDYGAAGRLSWQSLLPVSTVLAIGNLVFAITNFLRGH